MITIARLRAILAGEARRNAIMAALEDEGIATRQGTHAVRLLDYDSYTYGYAPMDLPGAFAADRLSLSLPLYAAMTDSEQDRVVERLGWHLSRQQDRVHAG